MPTTASIRFNGVATPNTTYKIGDTVSLSNFDDTGVSTWAWTLLSKPSGSTAVIASPSSPATSFVVDKEGSYLVRLVVNDTLPDEDQDTGVARILTQHLSLHAHAKDETGEGDPTEGWAKHWRDSYQTIDKRVGLSDRRTVKYVGANTTGPKVLVTTGIVTLPNGDVVHTVDILGPNVAGPVFLWETGALNTNDVKTVLVHGLSAPITNPDTMVAGDVAWLGTAGAITKTAPAADSTNHLGFCLAVSGPNVTLWFAPALRFDHGQPPLGPVVDGAGVFGAEVQVAHADHRHPLTTSSAGTVNLDSVTSTPGTAGTLPSRGDHAHRVLVGAPVAVIPDVAPATGAGPELATKDHQHGLTTFSGTPADLGTAAPGTAGTAPARGNHVHGHGVQAGGTLHADATPTTSGFESAADKTKLDDVWNTQQNYLINGAFDLWQRGTSFTVSQVGVGTSRAYTSDRWFGFARKDSGVSTLSGIYTKESGAAGSSRFSLRVQKNGATNVGFLGFTQEVERRLVEQLRGKKVTLRFRVKAGAGLTGSPLVVINTNGAAGNENQWFGTYGAGAEHQAFFFANPGTAFVTKTFTISTVLPSDMVGMAVSLGAYHDFATGGGATDFLEFAEISMVASTIAPTSFQYAAGSYAAEVALCRHFYDKSYELDTAPGSSEYNSIHQPSARGNGTILNGEEWYLQPRPRFAGEMRAIPTITIWTYTGTIGVWHIFDADRASVAIQATKKQFTVANNTGASVGLGNTSGEDTYGNWAADADI